MKNNHQFPILTTITIQVSDDFACTSTIVS
jgi:hypothetical protein